MESNRVKVLLTKENGELLDCFFVQDEASEILPIPKEQFTNVLATAIRAQIENLWETKEF